MVIRSWVYNLAGFQPSDWVRVAEEYQFMDQCGTTAPNDFLFSWKEMVQRAGSGRTGTGPGRIQTVLAEKLSWDSWWEPLPQLTWWRSRGTRRATTGFVWAGRVPHPAPADERNRRGAKNDESNLAAPSRIRMAALTMNGRYPFN